MNRLIAACLSATGLLLSITTFAAGPAVGAAPKGDASAVASRIIKYNFESCKHVTKAVRKEDGSIRARCDGTEYWVFTVFNAKEGRAMEVALNCAAAQKLASVTCP